MLTCVLFFGLLYGFILSLQTDPAPPHGCRNCDELDAAAGEAGPVLWRHRHGAEATVSEERLRVLRARYPALRQRESRLAPARPWWSAPAESRVEMADDLGDEWWENQPAGAASSPGTHSTRAPAGPPAPPALPWASARARGGGRRCGSARALRSKLGKRSTDTWNRQVWQ